MLKPFQEFDPWIAHDMFGHILVVGFGADPHIQCNMGYIAEKLGLPQHGREACQESLGELVANVPDSPALRWSHGHGPDAHRDHRGRRPLSQRHPALRRRGRDRCPRSRQAGC
eukprot:9481180-Pyramimonas_sp.AAC.1